MSATRKLTGGVLCLLFLQFVVVTGRVSTLCDEAASITDVGCPDGNTDYRLSKDGQLLDCTAPAIRLNCTSLSFYKKGIVSLSEKAFSKLSTLQELYLDGNFITELPDTVFHGLADLRTLNFAGNNISVLPNDIFKGLDKVTTLDVDYNPIATFPLVVLYDIPALEVLRFANVPVVGFNSQVKHIICGAEIYASNPNVTNTICWNQATYEFNLGNYTKSRTCYMRAVERGTREGHSVHEADMARYGLAHMLFNGMVGQKTLADYTDAYKYLLGASDSCATCKLKLADYFYEVKRDDPLAGFTDPDTGIPTKNNTHSWEIIEKCLNNNSISDAARIDAMNQAARAAYTGRRYGGQNYTLGKSYTDLVLDRTNGTDPMAMYHRARAYFEGWGVRRDTTMHREWLEKAALYGQVDACAELGLLYEHDRDLTKALQLYQNATLPQNVREVIVNPNTLDDVMAGLTRMNVLLEEEEHAHDHEMHTWEVVAIVFSCLAIIGLVVGLFLYCRQRKRREETVAQIESRMKAQGFNWVTDRDEGLRLIQKHRETQHETHPDQDHVWIEPDSVIRLNKLRSGKFGDVYRGVTLVEGYAIECAVKYIRNQDTDESSVKEFKREIALLTELNHPNVVPVIGAAIIPDLDSAHESSMFMAMEYMDLGSLENVLRAQQPDAHSSANITRKKSVVDTPYNAAEYLWFALQVARGVECLTANGIVHRDIDVRNVLVATRGISSSGQTWRTDKMYDCKIADLGLSRKLEEGGTYQRITSRPLPVRSMAPEIFRKEPDTAASDVYMMGIVIWEIYTLGRLPFDHLANGPTLLHRLQYEKETATYLEQPEDTMSNDIYEMTKHCWSPIAHERPHISDLASSLEFIFDRIKGSGNEEDEGELVGYAEGMIKKISHDLSGKLKRKKYLVTGQHTSRGSLGLEIRNEYDNISGSDYDNITTSPNAFAYDNLPASRSPYAVATTSDRARQQIVEEEDTRIEVQNDGYDNLSNLSEDLSDSMSDDKDQKASKAENDTYDNNLVSKLRDATSQMNLVDSSNQLVYKHDMSTATDTDLQEVMIECEPAVPNGP